MKSAIDRERLAATFTTLCEISSPSRREGGISAWLQEAFLALGASDIFVDNSNAATGSETGNLIVRFAGNQPANDGFFLSCHMDTVEPGENVEVLRTGDIFTSKGDTILGGDDKSGIAAILEMLRVIKDQGLSHPTIEVVITTCEEIGLLGAKHLEHNRLKAPYGYALDSTGTNHVIVGAPAANKITVEIKGLAAHAGLCPEAGINALAICAQVLSKLRLGRLDEESTCNFGLIQGGVATNIIPETVVLKGEVRSHNPEKLKEYTAGIERTFVETVAAWPEKSTGKGGRPKVSFQIDDDYPAMKLDLTAPVIQRIEKTARRLNRPLQYIIAGGGSDANIFNSFGLPTAIVATGMNKVHTLEEQLDLNDVFDLTELLLGLAVAGD